MSIMKSHALIKRNQQDDRRAQLAGLRRAGVRDYRVLAKALNTSPATVCRDLKVLEQQWREQAHAQIDYEKGLDLDRAEKVIAGLWTKAVGGNPQAALALLHWLKFRADVLGYAAPKVVKIDLEARLRAIAEEEGLDPDAMVIEAQAILREQSAA